MNRQKVGKSKRAEGQNFEKRVRDDLEQQGYIVDRWTNQVDLEKQKIVPAKITFRRTPMGMFPLGLNSGFPDFIAFNKDMIAVECKLTGKLDKLEKDKCRWLLERRIFDKILIASKTKEKNRVKIIYEEFKI